MRSIFILLSALVVVATARDAVLQSGECKLEDAATACKLACVFKKFASGYCDPAEVCHCTDAAIVPSDTDEKLSSCKSSDKEASGKCTLQCLFYPRYSGGYCQDDTCYCTTK